MMLQVKKKESMFIKKKKYIKSDRILYYIVKTLNCFGYSNLNIDHFVDL